MVDVEQPANLEVVYTLTDGSKLKQSDVTMEHVFDELCTVLMANGMHLGMVPELIRHLKSR